MTVCHCGKRKVSLVSCLPSNMRWKGQRQEKVGVVGWWQKRRWRDKGKTLGTEGGRMVKRERINLSLVRGFLTAGITPNYERQRLLWAIKCAGGGEFRMLKSTSWSYQTWLLGPLLTEPSLLTCFSMTTKSSHSQLCQFISVHWRTAKLQVMMPQGITFITFC